MKLNRSFDNATTLRRTMIRLVVVILALVVVGFSLLRYSPPAQITQSTTVAAVPNFILSFENDKVGSSAAPLDQSQMGGGGAGGWVVEQDGSKRVLMRTPAVSNTDSLTFAVFYGFFGKDVEVSTRFKTLSGNADPGGGLVVRYRDKDNNYFVRADARKNNVGLFRVINGKQTQFAVANANVTVDEWHQLTLSAKGSHFKVTYEGKPLFEADDPMIGNAAQDGYCGLYADSVTEFEMLIGTEQ